MFDGFVCIIIFDNALAIAMNKLETMKNEKFMEKKTYNFESECCYAHSLLF